MLASGFLPALDFFTAYFVNRLKVDLSVAASTMARVTLYFRTGAAVFILQRLFKSTARSSSWILMEMIVSLELNSTSKLFNSYTILCLLRRLSSGGGLRDHSG